MARPSPWPVFPTRLVERNAELSWLSEAIARGERLVTVFGPPGVGKTRLVVEALDAARAADVDGFFCPLGGARSEDDVALQVVRTIVGGNVPGGPARQAVVTALAALGPSLVVLDTFEHLLGVALPMLTEWVDTCADVTFLVTSRAVLRLPAEVALELAPLAVPHTVAELETAAGSRLLLEAVRRHRPAVQLLASDHEVFCDLVRRLDGLPLALEIVAPSVATLGIRLVHERLDRVLASAEAPSRRTLRDAIEWSWGLLDEPERAMLAQCTVFRGGFDLAALEQVVLANDPHDPRDERERPLVLPRLVALRDKSLVHLLPTPSGSRFGVYASIAELASEQLDRLGLREGAEHRHRACFAARARAITDRTSTEALELVRTERENLVIAIERAIAARDPAARSEVFAILGLIGPPLFVGAQPARLVALVESALATFGDADDSDTALAWLSIGVLLAFYPDTKDRGRFALERARDVSRACGDRALEAQVLSYLANLDASSPDDLVARLREAVGVARDSGDLAALAHTLSWTAITQCNAGDPDGALGNAREAVACATGPVQVVRARSLCAAVQLARGNLVEAETDVRTAMESARSHGFYAMEAEALNGLASALHLRGELFEAETAYRSAIQRCEAVGRKNFAAAMRIFLALALFEMEETQAARAEILLAEPVVDDRFDPTRPRAVATAVAAIIRSRVHRAPPDPSFFTADVNPEAAAVLARLGVVADLDVARRLHASLAGSGDVLAREARQRMAALREREAGRARGSVERALLDRMVQRYEAVWTEPLPATTDAIVVHHDGDWFRMPGGPLVSCARRQVLRLLLRALGQARRDRPGYTLPADALLETGWPGEQMSRESGRNRLKQAMAVLRRLGLGDALVSPGGGYRLAEDVDVQIA